MREKKLIEAALFVSTDPVSIEKLREMAGTKSDRETKRLIEELKKEYEGRESPIEIKEIVGFYLMQIKDEFTGEISHLVKPILSRDSLKTLSLIALRQPVTQAEIVKSRGYTAYSHVKELLGKEFISAEPFGRTKLLTTTEKFSNYFGMGEEPLDVRERLEDFMGNDSTGDQR